MVNFRNSVKKNISCFQKQLALPLIRLKVCFIKKGETTQNSAKPEILVMVRVRVRDRVRIRVWVRVMKKGEKSEKRQKT